MRKPDRVPPNFYSGSLASNGKKWYTPENPNKEMRHHVPAGMMSEKG
jgi:hypothetical protein